MALKPRVGNAAAVANGVSDAVAKVETAVGGWA